MDDKRTDLWYYGNLGDKEYNSEKKDYVLEPMNNCSKEKIVIMGYQIGTGTIIINGEKPNEYIEDLGELQIIYRYINDGNDLDIDWKWEKVEVKASEGELGVPKPLETIPEVESDVREIMFPDKIDGCVYGKEKKLYPNSNWAVKGGGNFTDPLKNNEGRYIVAVGPKILDSNYSDKGLVQLDELKKFNRNIDVVVQNIKTKKEETLQCWVKTNKAHSFNAYDNGKVKFNIDSGLVQTGIAYPNSWNAKHGWAFAPNNIDSSVIEFATTKELDFKISDYKLIKIIVYKNK